MYTKNFPSRLTIAIPKQEKLKSPIIDYIESRGFVLEESEDNETGVLFDSKGNIPNIRVEFVRASDALFLMERKVVSMAIIGSDIMIENTTGNQPRFQKPETKLDLDIATCTFELAVPNQQTEKFLKPQDLNGLRIATSYPNLLGEWLKENGVTPSEIIVREGGVESSIRMGIADAVADLVDTGGTMRRNKLASIFQIARTSAVCYAPCKGDTVSNLLINEFMRNLAGEPCTTRAYQEKQYALA